jgi:hypothetical protein
MVSLIEQLKTDLGPLYGEAEAAYASSEASEDDELYFNLGLSTAAYELVRTTREKFQGKPASEEESAIKTLSFLTFGLLHLHWIAEHKGENPEKTAKINKALESIFKNINIFALDEGDDFTFYNLLQEIKTLYKNTQKSSSWS